MSAENLQELFVEEVRDIYDAEKQLVKALPKMARAADSVELRSAFEEHLEITRAHVGRLEEVFKGLGMAARGKTCEGMKGLIEEGQEAMEELRGSMATAWFDEREPDTVYIARGVGRPLWLGATAQEAFFASTKAALEVVERYLDVKLRKRELPEGIVVPIVDGRRQKATRFRPDHAFEETPLPAVRAPQEGATCLRRLAVIAAAA